MDQFAKLNAGLPRNNDKRRVGRPTAYRPQFGERVLRWGAAGKSKTWMAAELGVTPGTLRGWTRAHPEFADRLALAMQLSQAFWEDLGQEGLRSRVFHASAWLRSMAARFPENWRESKKVRVSADEAFLGLWYYISEGDVVAPDGGV